MNRWPNRQYKVKRNTLEVDCGDLSWSCTAKGTLDFDDSSPARNARSWGSATFEYVLQFAVTSVVPRITQEGGTVIERHQEPFSSSPSTPYPSPLSTPCDELAANPTDQQKSSKNLGTPYNSLKLHAAKAVEECEAATAQYPNELRFQYQLGRALQFTDRRRALNILQGVAQSGYPASFDNVGWLYYSDLNNPAQAVQYFLQGVKLNDADAMMSFCGDDRQGQVRGANSGRGTNCLVQ